ncbi:MAG: hypothetical protein KJ947_00320 [Alphaproteobacteria bacterium]|nr:hypothetical protein [Alphaproteobacteria bacterium]MBU1548000.1 hypothetical protein [Alphaproteobacteria bacterium]MBU2336238.1 hypothetical protein [Alphaproteobacteria bacterium]MBU2390367.1 hypothetical protein [Alphaproteobacteria bacterium]|tara:strand:- start:154 stop:447 length:294 start_codon:yes stop_codon:yes gene_type:complete
METETIERYQMRQEEDGTWTVFDTTMLANRENRMIAGVSENRARQYGARLNKLLPPVLSHPSEQADAHEKRLERADGEDGVGRDRQGGGDLSSYASD